MPICTDPGFHLFCLVLKLRCDSHGNKPSHGQM